MAGDAGGSFMLYRYEPSMAAAIIFIILFLIVTLLHTYQLVMTKTWFFIPFVIGGFFQWIGYVGRAMSAAEESPNYALGPYILQTLLLLLAPALYAASIYMILGRVIALTDGEDYCLVPRKWLTKLFVFGDVLSFMLQSAGGGIMASGGLDSMHKGEQIIIGGLIVQVIFFTFFAITAGLFHFRLAQFPTRKVLSFDIPWQKYLYVLYVVSFLVIVRSLFRLIEYVQGNDGYLISHEVYLYVFDAVLMWLSMAAFAWEHPSEINAKLRRGGKAVKKFVDFYYTT
ncbi:RTA1 like protein [Paramyrothecium foliicola]|nr:RTA1 like protein [Paramyrothecium foliicola]